MSHGRFGSLVLSVLIVFFALPFAVNAHAGSGSLTEAQAYKVLHVFFRDAKSVTIVGIRSSSDGAKLVDFTLVKQPRRFSYGAPGFPTQYRTRIFSGAGTATFLVYENGKKVMTYVRLFDGGPYELAGGYSDWNNLNMSVN